MSNIFFSIIIPVYKPQFLKECIDSILAQTYRNFELILVNDGSPYDIDSIVGQYQDSRIEYHKREKGYGAVRLVDNWNDCLKYVKILEEVYSICRQCLDDEFSRDIMLEIINTIEDGLK